MSLPDLRRRVRTQCQRTVSCSRCGPVRAQGGCWTQSGCRACATAGMTCVCCWATQRTYTSGGWLFIFVAVQKITDLPETQTIDRCHTNHRGHADYNSQGRCSNQSCVVSCATCFADATLSDSIRPLSAHSSRLAPSPGARTKYRSKAVLAPLQSLVV